MHILLNSKLVKVKIASPVAFWGGILYAMEIPS